MDQNNSKNYFHEFAIYIVAICLLLGINISLWFNTGGTFNFSQKEERTPASIVEQSQIKRFPSNQNIFTVDCKKNELFFKTSSSLIQLHFKSCNLDIASIINQNTHFEASLFVKNNRFWHTDYIPLDDGNNLINVLTSDKKILTIVFQKENPEEFN